jgi:signal peptidase I
MSDQKHKKGSVREWIESIVIALLLAVVIRSYIVQPFKIPSGSMRMTLIEGDHLFVNKLRYGPTLLPTFQMDIPKLNASIKWPEALLPLTKKRLPGFDKPKRGDVIVFVYPNDRSKDFIKRLIGLPGDQVEIRDGKVWINGAPMVDERNKNIYYYNRGDFAPVRGVITVPPGHVFVLGDNSGSSHDSRYWGFVPEADIIGKAEFIFWPPNRIRMIQ